MTPESVGRQLRAALPPMRLHSLSIYDERANILWLSEGALGPDEHSAVMEGIDTLGREQARHAHESDLEDGRTALLLPARSPTGMLVGLVMILADSKSTGDNIIERLVTAQTRTALQKLAVLLRPASARTASGRVLTLAQPDAAPAQPTAAPAAPAASGAAPAARSTADLSPQAVSEILEFELSPEIPVIQPPPAAPVPQAPPATTAAAAAETASAASATRSLTLPEGMSLTLDLQQFVKLRAGGRSQRYEVLPRVTGDRAPPGLDRYVLQELLSWMGAHRGAWNGEPTSFTLNLSISTLEDERFAQFVAHNLKQHGIAGESIGFEITEALCLQRRAQVERFFDTCDKLGCFVVIDDFSFDSQIVSLLRARALRLVKIDPRLTSSALKDKLSQAMVVAIAQAVKVLGIHCAAKRVDAPAALQWLKAVGCDLAQGLAAATPHPLSSLRPTLG